MVALLTAFNTVSLVQRGASPPTLQGILRLGLRRCRPTRPEKEIDKECDRYRKVLQTRGYITYDAINVMIQVKWENKKDTLIKREEKKKKGKGEVPGTHDISSN